ncbi:MAG: MutS-related protein [Bacillota bacterium]
MKVHLMYRDKDFEPRTAWTPRQEVVATDLGLGILFNAMARDDRYLYGVVSSAVFDQLGSTEEISYRQAVLRDCLQNPDAVREIYSITERTFEERRQHLWGISSQFLSSVMFSSVRMLEMLVRMLRELRRVADTYESKFQSEGLCGLMATLQRELTDGYFEEVESHLKQLAFHDGMLVSAEIGRGCIATNYTLHSMLSDLKTKIKWHFAPKIAIHPRDDAGAHDLERRKDRAINLAADAVAQSTEHILSFFTALRAETAFYVGCVNLYETLREKGEPICFPVPLDMTEREHEFEGLYDVCLSLSIPSRTVGNSATAGKRDLVVITGANQGGKSTFLRSIGQAQLMMQCGMFVGAEEFRANVASGVFTHYKREEDAAMKHGKLDEELLRMSELIGEVKTHALILFNESFASTNEREGSEIARQIVSALLDEGVKVFFVTHMYALSGGFREQRAKDTLFLRAGRQPGGSRNFRLVEGVPLPTSYGEDLYREVFGKNLAGGPAQGRLGGEDDQSRSSVR